MLWQRVVVEKSWGGMAVVVLGEKYCHINKDKRIKEKNVYLAVVVCLLRCTGGGAGYHRRWGTGRRPLSMALRLSQNKMNNC